MKNAVTKRKIDDFQRAVWAYYRTHGRHDMIWRKTHDPYRIVVSEVMLQQTQVERVTPKYKEFIRRFPDFSALARAPLADVLSEWQGLGYNRRALFLKKLADVVAKKYKGKLPRDPEILHTLPGIGKATAGSIAAFAFNAPSVFIETNIRRVFIHFFFSDAKKIHDADIISLVEKAVDTKNPREWYFALMDYGTMLAAKEKENPNRKSAHYVKQKKFHGSDRQVRGKIVALLVTKKSFTARALVTKIKEPLERVEKILVRLEKEGFAQCKGKSFHIVS